jgi:serine/threonine-protein kinase RsbT
VALVHDVAAAEPVIRRVIAARAANPADIDDLVQDCLERLLTARGRLAPEAVLPYAIVTARNLVSSHYRNAARRAAAAPRLRPDR